MDPLKNNVINSAIIKDVATVKTNAYVNDLLAGIAGMESLEQHIFDLIDAFSKTATASTPTYSGDLEKIFHLIQIWGGITGRMPYIGSGSIKISGWSSIEPYYIDIVIACLDLSPTIPTSTSRKADLTTFYKTVDSLSKNIYGLGASFLSKHIRFWTRESLGSNALPIYDSFMKNNYIDATGKVPSGIVEYWEMMIDDPRKILYDNSGSPHTLTLMEYERKLFNFYTI